MNSHRELNSNKLISYKLPAVQGFSILEFLIYIAVLSIVAILIGGTFVSINQGRGRSTARTEVSSAIRFALDQMRQDIMTSTAITTPQYGRIITCGATTNCLAATVDGSAVTYDVTTSQIRRNTTPITPTTVNITLLTVEYFGNNSTSASILNQTFQVKIMGAYNSSSPSYQYSETRQATFAPSLAATNTTRGAIGSGGAGSGGSCIIILGIPVCL